MTTGILKDAKGHTLAVFADAAEAQRRADRYNADPYLEESTTPDPDAPYSVEAWAVTE